MKQSSKSGLLKSFGPILRFNINSPPWNSWSRISWLLFGIKNHKMQEPPALKFIDIQMKKNTHANIAYQT